MEKSVTPKFFDLLTTDDQDLYKNLKNEVGSPNYRYKRNQSSSFEKLLQMIHEYCDHDDLDTWKRYLVCGICWFEDYIAINISNLKLLLSKSKSSINGSMTNLGYKTLAIKGKEVESLLFNKIPMLWGNYCEFRKWSIRKNETNKINETSNKIDDLFDDLFKDIEWCDDCITNKEETKTDIIDLNIDNDEFNFDLSSFADESCTMMY